MKKIYFIIKFTVLIPFKSSKSSNCVNFSSENATSWTEAESYCRSNKTSQIQTLSIRDFGLNSELHDIVIRYEKNAVLWTGLKRRTYPEWNSGKFTGSILYYFCNILIYIYYYFI